MATIHPSGLFEIVPKKNNAPSPIHSLPAETPSHTGVLKNLEGTTKFDTGAKSFDATKITASGRENQDLEQSRPSTPSSIEPAFVRQTWNNPPINKWRIVAACLVALGNGMNDAAPGALLPYIEKYYGIGYAVVSTVFIANAVGFILAAFFVQKLDSRFGRAKTLIMNEVILVTGYVIMAIPPPFGVFAVGYFIVGYGLATNLALNNVFTANLANPTVVLSCFHGFYGLGGLISPIIATSMVNIGVKFSYFFFILLGLRALNCLLSGSTFWHFERDNPVGPATRSTENIELNSSNAPTAGNNNSSKQVRLLDALKNKSTLIGALFIFAYQGAEVSISGWIISFLITSRGGDPARVGYVTAGFWGGVTFGRFALNNLAIRIGEKIFTFGLIAGAFAFQLVVWFAPNVIADSIATAIIGVLLGPMYPCAMTVMSRLLPRAQQATALAFVSSAGSSGGAVAPFLTGLIAQARGTWVLHPICLSLFALMQACWWALTKDYHKRKE